MNRIKYILYLLTAVFGITACSDNLIDSEGGTGVPDADKGIGQMVLFSAGNIGNTSASTRATIPYMETDGRFVCTMYFHGNSGATETSYFDVEDENSRATSYMKVFDVKKPAATGTESMGNSVYWSRDYSDITGNDLNETTYTTYGFDPRVEPFYWKNRLPHVFVGYTDYHKLKDITYNTTTNQEETVPTQGSLFMYPDADGVRKVKTGETVKWVPQSATVLKFSRDVMTLEQFNDKKPHQQITQEQFDQLPAAAKIRTQADGESQAVYYTYDEYIALDGITQAQFDALPESLKYVEPAAWTLTEVAKNQSPVTSTYSSVDFYGTRHYSDRWDAWCDNAKTSIIAAIAASNLSDADKTKLTAEVNRDADTPEETTVNGTFHNSCCTVNFDVSYNIGFEDYYDNPGEAIDLGASSTTVFFSHEKKSVEETYEEQPANTFDLTRSDGMTKITDQPDPILAVTKMRPTGATQEANRVRLYFKHQFAQIQVNMQKVEGNTDDIAAENIVGVELLGVTKKGYVFTLPNKEGEAIAPAYDAVDVSKLTAEQYAQNRYGTSFQMFEMSESDKPTTSLKSFNAIAFGMLQALRVTWKEPLPEGVNDPDQQIVHTATFPITVDEQNHDLKTLQSGMRYIYDLRLARGMLASIRVTIKGWELSPDLNYREDGIITDAPVSGSE